MKPGTFTDSGYRYRENEFNGIDSIFGAFAGSVRTVFYDLTFFSSDTLPVALDFPRVAEMYFRLSIEKVEHQRVVYKFMDWLGAMGGVEKILMKLLTVVIGGYI